MEKESKTWESKFSTTHAKKAYIGSGVSAPQIRSLHCRWKWSASRFGYLIGGEEPILGLPTAQEDGWVSERVDFSGKGKIFYPCRDPNHGSSSP